MKPKSYLLLFLLVLLLIFVIGVRYGQNVEKTNEAINYVLSITPTKQPSPTMPLEFTPYENKQCGIRFIVPSLLSLKKESSNSAVFVENNKQVLEVNCDRQNQIMDELNSPNVATAEVNFKNRKTPIKVANNDIYIMRLINLKTGLPFYVSIRKSLFPLFENSLQYL